MVLPNYTNNFLRLGFTEDDLLDGGSDRLVDGVIAWGDLDAIAARIGEHHAAGADHVCVQVLQADAAALPRDAWRRLADVML
jgi:probable F420-dependent oxidoreductase